MATQINLTAGSNTYAITVAPVANINVTISRTVVGSVSANTAITANFANYAGNVTTSAQPNITSLGILTGLVVAGNITPNANITYNLGNNTNRFNDLYLANSTIYIGNETISANATTIVVGNLAVTGTFLANSLVANTANYANYAGVSNVANSVAGANVSGEVAFAATANAVAGANVSGEVTFAATANAVAGANVSGEVTFAATANAVAGANVSGEVTFAATANAVAVANVSGIGNIATINLDGNASTILYGNGVFAADASNGNANFASYAGVVTTNAQPNITSVGTLTDLTISGNLSTANLVVTDSVGGNLIPNANITYDLGNATNRWNDLYLANTTIFLGANSTISAGSLTNGNSNIIITLDGDVSTSVGGAANIIVATGTGVNIAGTLDATGNITGGNLITAGFANIGTDLSVIGNANIGTDLSVIGNANIGTDLSVIGNANIGIDLSVIGNANITGNINFLGNSNSVIQQDYANGATTLTIYGGSHATILSLDGLGDANLEANGNVKLTANSQGAIADWKFGMNGNLTLPGGGGVWTLGADTAGLTANMSDPYPVYLGLDYTSNVATLAANTAVVIQTNTGDPKIWTFDTTGNLVLPGNTFAINFANGSPAQLANANYANFAGTAYSVDGANVVGAVAYATTANAVAGANVSGEVTFAATANAVAGANVSGEVTYAATANAVAGANVSGEVTFAATANAVAGANVSGEVAFAATANSVAVANVSGIGNIATINLNGNASTILYGNGVFAADASNGNANFASYAGVVTTNAQPNITSVGTLTNLNVSNLQIHLGSNAGITSQGANSIAIGTEAANTSQGTQSIAIGLQAGSLTQGANAVAIGVGAGSTTQGANAVAIGRFAGSSYQQAGAIAIGRNAGITFANVLGQGANAIAIGSLAGGQGNLGQGERAIAIGRQAGTVNQGANAIAIGEFAGSNVQSAAAIAIGFQAGNSIQGANSIAIGYQSSNISQGSHSIGIGWKSASNVQGANSIAIGTAAGFNSQGANSVAIGANAGYTSQAVNTIILNATGANLDQTTANTFTVKPVRAANTSNALFYNSTSGEISYDLIGNIITVNLDGNASTVLYGNGVFAASAGGNGTPGGSNTQIQFNDANAFGGNTGFTFDKTTGAFAVPGTATLTGLTVSNATGVVDFTTSANVTLGAVANLHISGGTANYVLQTNGSGTLTWVAQSGGGNANNITNGNSSVDIATSGGVVTTSVAGNANIIIATGTGVNVAGTLNTTGNVAFSGANISLGAIGNVKITGGANAEFIRTDGAGNLSFVSVAETLLVGTRVGPYTVPITNYTFIVTARTGNVTIYVN